MLLLQVIVGGLLLGAIYALFSSGLTLIWGMMNFINFAHGEFVMLGMYVALLVVVWLGGGPATFGFAAAFALFVLGVVIYAGLIRHVIRGPMLAQILSTFGLALFIRYTAFWLFSANFVTLPEGTLGGTVNLGGIYLGMPQLVAGIVAIVLEVCRFVVPFLILIIPQWQRNRAAVALVCLLLIVTTIVRSWWLVLPAFGRGIGVFDVACMLVFIGLAGGTACRSVTRSRVKREAIGHV